KWSGWAARSLAWAQTRARCRGHHTRPSSCTRTVPCPRVRAGPTARESPALRNEDPSWIVNILQGPPGVKFWRERRSRDNSYQEEATCPPYRRPPTRRESDLRELTRLDHLNQDVPFILLEDSDISS